MSHSYTETVLLRETICCVCGVTFAAPERLLKERERTGTVFYCPNGHTLNYNDSEEKRLRSTLNEKERAIATLEAKLVSVRDQFQATQKEARAVKKRVTNGVCPCCSRTFAQLQRHRKAKHPEMVEEEEFLLVKQENAHG